MPVIASLGEQQPRIADDVFLATNATVVGDVELDAEVSVWYGAVLRGDVGRIRIGARSNVQDNATIHMTFGSSDALIGEEVIVGHNAVIHGGVVANRALIGLGSVVMDNATIGEASWVAAGSVVPPNMVVPAGMLARGCPAKVVRPLREEELRWAREAVERYLNLARRHRQAVPVERQ